MFMSKAQFDYIDRKQSDYGKQLADISVKAWEKLTYHSDRLEVEAALKARADYLHYVYRGHLYMSTIPDMEKISRPNGSTDGF